MNAPHHPEKPPEPLIIKEVWATDCVSATPRIELVLNRVPTDGELEAYRKLPPTPQMYVDVRSYAERMELAELVVRLFRFYILGGVVMPDSPLAMDWLKSFIDGNGGHGPLGSGPLRWPSLVPTACNILTRWGFMPTDTVPPYVAKRPPS